jgi:hypothetical protein
MNAAIGFRPRAAWTFLAAALACFTVLALGASGARATVTHPTATYTFGPDGTEATEFENVTGLTLNQANGHLFVHAQNDLYGYGVTSPAARTPLGPPYPLEIEATGNFPSVTATPTGNLYYYSGRNVFGIKENGEKIAERFPVTPPLTEGYACGSALDSNGNLWVEMNEAIWYETTLFVEYGPEGGEKRQMRFPEEFGNLCALAINTKTNDMYVSEGQGGEAGTFRFTGASNYEKGSLFTPVSARHLAVDSATGVVYITVNDWRNSSYYVEAFSAAGVPLEEFADGNQEIHDIAINEADGTVYVGRYNKVEVFPPGPIIAEAETQAAVAATGTSATVSGSVDLAGGPAISTCKFEYGESTQYELGAVPCDQATPLESAGSVTATLSGLKPGRKYHYRLVVENGNGTTRGADQMTQTASSPTIDSLSSANVTSDAAELSARINPQGAATNYFFEYGPSAQYGSRIPASPVAIGSGQTDVRVSQQLSGLQATTYHFRVVAENAIGRTLSPDQTLNYYPPECPNAHQRQQTGGSYLPDCRAYELVSPGDAGGAIMFPDTAPETPYASNPARFAFGAGLGVIPGTEPANGVGVDTFIATRTDTGWVTHLGGLRGSETLNSSLIWGDKSFDKVLDFRAPEDFGGVPQPHEYMPFLWDSENNFLGRWPVNFESIPGSNESRGAYQPSADFSHLAFSSNNVAFAKGGLEEAPGSAYDYDAANHTTTLISLLPDGRPIPQDPATTEANEFIFFPGNQIQTIGFTPPVPNVGQPARGEMSGVSEDGSHILMATTKGGYVGGFEAGDTENVILYMRVNDAVTYEVSEGKAVNYEGMTADGTEVYFTSAEQLGTDKEDKDSSTDLYVWNQATQKIKLVSAGAGAGNTSSCPASEWAPNCEVEVVHGEKFTDNSLAANSGDIYFYSPELLTGENHGSPGKRNLYVYREGSLRFVATFGEAIKQAVSRIQVSPDGAHMALLTKSQLTSYDNGGKSEMYSWEPASEKLICVSCLPDGEEPTSSVEASLDGLFMSNDGRTFFYTADPLVPRDTDKIHDVYEYTEGQAQLISSGTGSQDRTKKSNSRPGGLSGVSANGVDAYFVTYENLVPQDLNGQFLKFYDARVGGGFPYVQPAAQCEAADECHSEGSSSPTLAQIVSENSLGAGGNAEPPAKAKANSKKKKHKKKHKKHGKGKKKNAKRKQASQRRARTGGKGR